MTAGNRKHSVFSGKTIRNCCNPSWAIAGACHLSDNILTESKGNISDLTILSDITQIILLSFAIRRFNSPSYWKWNQTRSEWQQQDYRIRLEHTRFGLFRFCSAGKYRLIPHRFCPVFHRQWLLCCSQLA